MELVNQPSTPRIQPRAQSRLWQKISSRENLYGWGFIAPYMLLFACYLLYPFIKGIWISLHDWNLLAVAFDPGAKTFIGLDNYAKLLLPRRWDYQWDQLLWLRSLLSLALVGMSYAWYRKGTLTVGRLCWLAAGLFITLYLMGWGPEGRARIGDRRFYTAVFNTIEFVLLAVPSITALALALAIQLNKTTKTAAVLRTVFFSSQILSVTVVTLIWQLMYSPQQGFIANLLGQFNLTAPSWLTDQSLAMPAIVITTVWWSLGFALVVFLSGLQKIPADRLEAARIDGARGWRMIRYIILPSIKRTTAFVIVMQIILHFQVFGQSHLMTNGGPGDSTQVLVRYIYQTAFRDSEVGYASAMAVILFLLMMMFSLAQTRINRVED